MALKMEVKVDKVYGVLKLYPVSAEAKAIAKIAGTKTLTPAVLGIAMAELGASLVVSGKADALEVAKMIAAETYMPLDSSAVPA